LNAVWRFESEHGDAEFFFRTGSTGPTCSLSQRLSMHYIVEQAMLDRIAELCFEEEEFVLLHDRQQSPDMLAVLTPEYSLQRWTGCARPDC
jgi:hypothetical protein